MLIYLLLILKDSKSIHEGGNLNIYLTILVGYVDGYTTTIYFVFWLSFTVLNPILILYLFFIIVSSFMLYFDVIFICLKSPLLFLLLLLRLWPRIMLYFDVIFICLKSPLLYMNRNERR